MKQEKIIILRKDHKELVNKVQNIDPIQDSKKETEIWDKLSNEALENFENSY
jgi:hypothetical protein|tara:strand:- start:94 stop:249 length:156 start_codon:yes stop_codon:yes gene_type:complete